MKKTTSPKLEEDEIETMVKKYIDKHLPRSVSKVGGSSMSNNSKADKPQKAASNRIINTIKINLTKPRGSGSGQPKVKKEVDIAKTEQELQELERKDLEFQRTNIGFNNPSVFGYNQTDFIEHARNIRMKEQEDKLRSQRNQEPEEYVNEIIREPPKEQMYREPESKSQENEFYRVTSKPQVGSAALSLYNQPSIFESKTFPSDFEQRLSEQGYTEPQVIDEMSEEIGSRRETPSIPKMDERLLTKAGTERKQRGRKFGSKNKPKSQQEEEGEDIIPEPSAPTRVERERKPRGRPAGSKNKPKPQQSETMVEGGLTVSVEKQGGGLRG